MAHAKLSSHRTFVAGVGSTSASTDVWLWNWNNFCLIFAKLRQNSLSWSDSVCCKWSQAFCVIDALQLNSVDITWRLIFLGDRKENRQSSGFGIRCLGISYLQGNSCTSKNNSTSMWNFIPDCELGQLFVLQWLFLPDCIFCSQHEHRSA